MANFRTSKLDYIGLTDFLGNKTQKILGHNTICFKDGESIKVQYHDTVIVTLLPDQTIFSNGGFYTSTTKQRINEFMPYGYTIAQNKGLWHVYYSNFSNGSDMGIFDHTCTFDLTENKFTGLKIDGLERSKAMKQIKAYCKAYMIELSSGRMESPSSGDCFFCQGMFPESFDHMESHIDESYYVPSLILRAIDYQDKTSQIAKYAIQQLWNKEDNIPDTFISVLMDQGYKTLYGFILHCYDQKDK